MTNLSKFDVNGPGNPENTIFGLPFTEEDAAVVLLSVPWEVTVSCGCGASRSPEFICKASTQVDPTPGRKVFICATQTGNC